MGRFYRVALVFLILAMPVLVFGDQNGGTIVDANVIKSEPASVIIDPLSVRPVYLIQTKGNEVLGTATGFIVSKGEKKYLITNWHVVAGRHPQSNQPIHKAKYQMRYSYGTMGKHWDHGFESKKSF
jgi:hypothetical protein